MDLRPVAIANLPGTFGCRRCAIYHRTGRAAGRIGMTERLRRPTLHLKTPPAQADPVAAAVRWKCKPCGAPFEVSRTLQDQEVVRCPACNARLGRAEQFWTEAG